MALDIAILNDTGEPDTTVSIRINEHARLLRIVDDGTPRLLLRLRDYYEDAEFELCELDELTRELESLQTRTHGDSELAALVSNLRKLVLSARASNKPIFAIAD